MSEHENCRDLLATLSDYMDAILQEELCRELERHMSSCEKCRIVVNTLRRTIELYQVTARVPALPEDVRHRLYHRLEMDDYLGD
jgi:predicted anti-sigma-YlaC factor YlaD